MPIFSAFILAFTAVVMTQQAPDCVSLAREVPEEISNYYHPHETDCNHYYQCAEYGLVLMNCPEALHFDKDSHQCGWPHEVVCGSSG